MSETPGDFSELIRKRRVELSSQPPKRRQRRLDPETAARKQRVEQVLTTAQRIGPAAAKAGIQTEVALVDTIREPRLLWGYRLRDETIARGWRLVLETHEHPNQGLERNITDAIRYSYNGVALTTVGALYVFEGANDTQISTRRATEVSEFAGKYGWDIPGLDYKGHHGLESLEVGLADFIIRHGLDGEAPIVPPGEHA